MKARNEPFGSAKDGGCPAMRRLLTATAKWGQIVKFSFQVSSHSTSPMSLREPVRQKKLLEQALEWLEWGTAHGH
ncbi:hypothetical protein E4U60_001944 [Claviceps pazoutovae]|uniref:Uncharacterized protein n=1 Tax=Claviceps pazoutovae TaxID=1649127 RepID=A0A9P7MBM8_9HYPO|nr:hypothetical protein E4U60_001944 [Claviceps pazoutovae]